MRSESEFAFNHNNKLYCQKYLVGSCFFEMAAFRERFIGCETTMQKVSRYWVKSFFPIQKQFNDPNNKSRSNHPLTFKTDEKVK